MEPFQNPPFAQALYIQSLVPEVLGATLPKLGSTYEGFRNDAFVRNKKIGAGQLQMDEVLQKKQE